MTHHDLVATILLEVTKFGTFWANNTGAVKVEDRFIRYGCPGSPDILGCLKGRFVGIEAKVGRDRQSARQKLFAEAVGRNRGIYILARSLDDVTNRLRVEGLL